jgi:hypothetical protein
MKRMRLLRPSAGSQRLAVWVVVGLGLAGCDDDGTTAASVDARVQDQSVFDASHDALIDAAPRVDRGPTDAAPADAAPADAAPADASPDAGLPPLAPPEAFERYCRGTAPVAIPTTLGPAPGTFLGGYQGLPIGTWETVKVVPAQPFRVRAIQVAFSGGAGQATFHLTESQGRSYPDRDRPLMRPIQVGIEDPDPEVPVIIELREPVYLEPSQHYILSYQHRAESPTLAVEKAPAGEIGWSLIHVPDEDTPYGVADEDGSAANFRMSLIGDHFCELEAPSFVRRVPEAFASVASGRVTVADLDGDGHDDLILNDGGARAFLGDGALGFREADVFPAGNRAAMTVFGDLDNDGDVDAFAPTYVQPDGDGDGLRIEAGDCDDTDPEVHVGVPEVQGNQKDDDCDGQVDDVVCRPQVEVQNAQDDDCDGRADETFANGVWLNEGERFTPVPNPGFGGFDPTGAAALGDTDGDGFLDAYWGNWLLRYPQPAAEPDHFVRGLGNGTFEDRTEAVGMNVYAPRACYGAIFTDFDNDGRPDLWVGNYGYGENVLWQNQGDGTFIDRAPALGAHRDGEGRQGGNTYGAAVGDVDNDGDVDFYVPNIAHPRYQPWSDPSHLLLNNGPDTPFTLVREAVGLVFDEGDVNAAFGDYDNDGDLDLAVASLYTTHYSRLYRNDTGPEGVRWTDVTWETGTAVHDAIAAVWADFDEDGDLELALSDRAGLPQVQVFENQAANGNHWILLDLQGTTTNRGAVGARVTLTAGGKTQIREVSGGGGHANAQSSRLVHFGLGRSEQIDEITVRWVGGATEVFAGPAVDARTRLVEGTGMRRE